MSQTDLHRYRAGKLFGSRRVPMLVVRAEHDHGERPHDHDFIEAAFVLTGSATHRCVHGQRSLRRGDVILLRPGAWHAYESCKRLRVYNCCFSQALLRSELAWTMDDPPMNQLLWSDLFSTGQGVTFHRLEPRPMREAERTLDALAAGLADPAAHRAAQVGRLLVILDLLAGSSEAPKPKATDRTPPGVWTVLRLMESDLATPWTSAELAERVHLDRSYLVRRFKIATGLPPLAYLARRRAERAASLLASTDRPIARIAVDVGWDDPAYFARRFRQQFAMTAGEYRERFSSKRSARASSR